MSCPGDPSTVRRMTDGLADGPVLSLVDGRRRNRARCRAFDISTGTGEAALMALPVTGASGFVVGADISPAMLEGARERLNSPSFLPVAADGQALPFTDGVDAAVCQLGFYSFSWIRPRADGIPSCPPPWLPRRGMCHLYLRSGANVGILADALSHFLPGSEEFHLSRVALADPR